MMISYTSDYKYHCYKHRNDRDDFGRYLHPIWKRWWWWIDWESESGIWTRLMIEVFVTCVIYFFLIVFLLGVGVFSEAITFEQVMGLFK